MVSVLSLPEKPIAQFGGWDRLGFDTLPAALAPPDASVEAARDVLQIRIDILRWERSS